ncbi:phosphate ABC transporter permease PstA [Candidatus Borrarchaeum sp.]|uniref:phosphate ABC transporter permease PstA n=1 Tax=Candidatus Borrarchaeum sp. TaxID=2846742 RepID=UPI0025810C74|nr:phosphate ABC transporter permease PstA [Candidatus Borrarchaeum sp.]
MPPLSANKYVQKIFFTLTGIAVVIIMGVLFFLLGLIFIRGAPVINLEFLTQAPRKGMTEGGIMPAIIGTLLLVAFAVAFALPVGLFGAIYLVEYAKEGRITRIINEAIENLNAVPSIVFGLFGLAFFVTFLGFGRSILSASLTLAMMILPTVMVTSVEALKAIPQSFREGSLALGASKWRTIQDVVLPEAFAGVLTGVILAIGRVAGETAPILFTGVVYYKYALPSSPFDQTMALTYHLFVLATESPDIAKTRPIQYGTALVLVGLVLLVDATAIYIRRNILSKRRW